MISDYLADVQRYDRHADSDTVQRIVRHLGLALKRRDAATVACEDAAERARVAAGWCRGKLGIADTKEAEAAIAAACTLMAADRLKQRVTFYYLVARETGRLGAL